MSILILIIGAILLASVLAVIYRILTLFNIAVGKKTKSRVGISNKINAILFPIAFILGFGWIFLYSGGAAENFLPEAASEHGVRTDGLFWTSMAVVSAAFFLTHILLLVFPFKYQYNENRRAHFYPHNDKLEIIWTVIPAIVMTVLVISGYSVWSDVMSPAPEESTVVEIMGKQFNWQVRYPGKDKKLGDYDFKAIDATNSMGINFQNPSALDDFTPREIHIPKGRPVLLKIRARDVLHSVFMPHFRVKMDAVPGMQTQFWFTPTHTTAEMREEVGNPEFNYELACTEVCGSGHFAMRMQIVVDEPADFEKWVNEQESWASKNKDYLSSIGIDISNLAVTE